MQLLDCSLQAIPPCVASLSTLKFLNVSGNSLHALPVAPYLSCLETLWAADCEITAFPLEAISRATALTQLHIYGNHFEWTDEANEAVKEIEDVER
jgi:Leucine-rich repeat (LRR) protein